MSPVKPYDKESATKIEEKWQLSWNLLQNDSAYCEQRSLLFHKHAVIIWEIYGGNQQQQALFCLSNLTGLFLSGLIH